MENLWSFTEDKNLENPIEILKSQVKYLEDMTDKCVSANLIEDKNETNEFSYIFAITSPYLPNYSFKAFKVKCSPILYPVFINCDENIAKELGLGLPFIDEDYIYEDIICEDTEQYKSKLKKVLGSTYMNKVLSSVKLMAQTNFTF